MYPSEEDVLNLSGKDWKPLPRLARTIPFGYEIDPEDDKTIIPVVFELEALEQAKKHLKNGHSLRTVANWLTSATGKRISHAGLKKRVDIERLRTNKARTLKKWATVYKKALEEARKTSERIGKDVSDLQAEIDAAEDPEAIT